MESFDGLRRAGRPTPDGRQRANNVSDRVSVIQWSNRTEDNKENRVLLFEKPVVRRPNAGLFLNHSCVTLS